MNYLSVCSGIEAAAVAWHPLGWRAFAYSEIERFPCAVLAHHYPDTPNLGDMTRFQEWPDADIDVLVGGTPCQSFSVAGLRKGLDDPRGNLMLTYGAIAGRYRPRWLVWENVPGVLSSNGGRDFGTFLGMLAELGFGFAYRILDAQYFGVAQRRRRVFVVGYLGDWRRAAAVLFERESLSRHPAPRREAREGIAPTLSARTKGGGGLGTDFDCDGGLIAATFSGDDIAPTIIKSMSSGVGSTQDAQVIAVAHTLKGEGFDASEDGTGRGTPLVPVVHVVNGNSTPETMADCAFPLRANDGSGNRQALAFDCKASGRNGFGVGEISPTLRSMGHATSHANGGGHAAVSRGMAVRRLTPVECERLQGFPDSYTNIRERGKPTPDGPRYKALGNSMAVPCMRWLGERIAAVDAIKAKREAA
jgi:DNA (cytosine-5)-methyltransferase 1